MTAQRYGVSVCLAVLLMGMAVPGVAAQEQAVMPVSTWPGAAPARIDIPSLGTHAAIVPLGLDDDGAMAAPTDPDTVGWWQDGPGLGGAGNMLLDGHVDWGGQLRVFGLLNLLDEGDVITVTDSDGSSKSFSVVWTRLYDADTAPLGEIFPTTPEEQLTLITCGGAFDQAAHMYVSRWIVRAAPVSAH